MPEKLPAQPYSGKGQSRKVQSRSSSPSRNEDSGSGGKIHPARWKYSHCSWPLMSFVVLQQKVPHADGCKNTPQHHFF